jgi:hypothetical protein
MKTTATDYSADTRRAVSEPQQFPPLELVNRPTVDTAAAAHFLNRKPQTLSRLLKYSPPTLCACHRGRTIETFPRTTRLAIHARSRHLHREPVHHAPSR